MMGRLRLLVACAVAHYGGGADWRSARFWPAVEATLGPAPRMPKARRCAVGGGNETACRGALLLVGTYRPSAEALASIAAFGQRLRRVLKHQVPVLVVTERPYDEATVRAAFRDFALRIREIGDDEKAAQDRLPFWLRQWYKHAVAAREVAAMEKRHGSPLDFLAKFRFDSVLTLEDDSAAAALVESTLAEPDALWAQIEMQWVGSRGVVGAFLDALQSDAVAPEAYELYLNGTTLRRWDRKPTDAWFKMMAASDLMFPGYGDASLDELRATGATERWVRTKPPFWPGVSSEELFVGAALRRNFALKDLAGAAGVSECTWLKNWIRWVAVDGCKLGNVVKLDGPSDVATYGAAAFDVKIYPVGANASKGRFNAYFTRNLSDVDLEAVVSERVRRENPTCAATKYVYGEGMLERIYPAFWATEMAKGAR